MTARRVQLLYFEGCPNHAATQELVERVAGELGVAVEVERIEVPDADTAATLRFLGSPTVRVEGRDVEPGAEERCEYVLSCRIYRGEHGLAGQPDAAWIRAALAGDTA